MQIHSDISEIEQSQWQQLVAESSMASFFQTPECYNFYASLSFLKPFIFGVTENNKLVGILCGYVISEGNNLKRFFSRRAIVPGGALLSNNISGQALQLLLKSAANQLKDKAIYLELRNYNDYSLFKPVFESAGYKYVSHLNFHISTPDAETALKNISASKRRQIKQSIESGATVAIASTPEEIDEYYSILKNTYRLKVKLPLFPLEFFQKIVNHNVGKIILLKYNEKVIGGMCCVFLNKTTAYEWFVCGDDSVGKNMFSSVLATWAGIEYAASNGYERFDFMGAGIPGKEYGVREFKSKFGGELVENGRFLYICNPLQFKSGKLIVSLLKHFAFQR